MDYKVSIEFSAETQKLLGGIQGMTGAVTGFSQAHGKAEEQLRKDIAEGEAAVKKLQARLVELYAMRARGGQTEALKKEIDLTEKAAQALQADLKKMSSALGEADQQAGHASKGIGSMAGAMAIGTLAAHLLERGMALVKDTLGQIVGEGLRFNAAMESARLGIGTLIAAQSVLKDATGRTLQGQEALTAAQGLAEAQVQKLKVAGLETNATTEQLVVAFQQALGPGLAAGMALDQVRKITVQLTQAAGALGLPMNQLGEEIRSLLNGNIDPRNTRIATALNITNEKIRELKAQGPGELYDYLSQRMETFTLAGEKAAQTWAGVTSNTIEAGQTFAGEMGKPLFESIKTGLQDALEGAFDLKEARISDSLQGLVDLSQSVFSRLGDLAGTGITRVMGWLEQLSAWYVRNESEVQGLMAVAGNLSSFLTGTLGLAFSVVLGTANALVTLLGTYPSVTTVVIFALAGLALANTLGALSFEAVATKAFWAAGAVYEFWLSIGPVGWAVAALSALVGVLVAVAQSTERAKKAQQEHAEALHKSTVAAGELNDRYQTLNERIKNGTLTLGERISAEKEMRDILEKLKRTGEDYLKGIDLEKMSLEQLAVVIQKVTDKRNAEEAAKRKQAKGELEAARAALLEAKQRVERMEQGLLPENGKKMSPSQEMEAAQGWLDRERDQLKQHQDEVARLTKLVETYGGEEEKVSLTLAQQVETRDKLIREEKELQALRIKLLAAPDSADADTQFTKTLARLKEIEKEKAKLKASGITVENRPEKAHANPDNKFQDERLRLKGEELRYAERLTMAAREQAELDKVDLDLEAERVKTKREQEKGTLKPGERSQLLAQAEENALKAKANIRAKYADEARKFEEKHQLEVLQIQGRGLESQVLQRRQAALSKVEDMRKHGATETEIAVYQAAVQSGIDRDLAKAAEDLQEKLITSQGKGWERRKALIDKEFNELKEKLKAFNQAMIQEGKLDAASLGPSGLTNDQEDQIGIVRSNKVDQAHTDQVREDVGKLKQELAELAQIKGSALDFNEESEVMVRFAKQGDTAAEAVAKLRQELHRDDGAGKGFLAGLKGFTTQAGSYFEQFKNLATSILGGLSNAFASFFTSLTQRGTTAAQKWHALWMGMSGAVSQALSKMLADRLVSWATEKVISAWQDTDVAKRIAKEKLAAASKLASEHTKTASVVTGMATQTGAVTTGLAAQTAVGQTSTTTTVAQNAVKSSSNTGTAATGFFSSFAGVGPWGFALAAAAIVAMFALLGSLTGRAVGGLVGEHGPEMTLLGERGLEVVAPEHDFKHWAKNLQNAGANLGYNLAQQERQTQGYNLQASSYAMEAQRQGDRNVSNGQSYIGGSGPIHNYDGAMIVAVNSRQWEDMVAKGQRGYEARRS